MKADFQSQNKYKKYSFPVKPGVPATKIKIEIIQNRKQNLQSGDRSLNFDPFLVYPRRL